MKIYLLLILFSNILFCQENYTITGLVKEKNIPNKPIYYANVILKDLKDKGIKKGTITDFDGSYKINTSAGKYVIQFSLIGYKTIEDTIILGDRNKIVIDKYLEQDIKTLSDIIVSSKIDKSNKKTSLLIQKKSTDIFHSISKEELSIKGISNVEDGLNKVSGVSKFRSMGIFVRGLGDRYNNVLFNGMPISSLNPDMKVIRLDIFPSFIIRNIEVSKTYSAKHYGDVAGATVNIFTKELEKNFFNISLGSKLNMSTPLSSLKIKNNSLSQYFGFFGKEYDIPTVVSSNNKYFEASPSESYSLLPNVYSVNYMPLLPVDIKLESAYNYDISFESNIGVIISVSFKNKYSEINGKKRLLNASADPLYSYDFDQWEYKTNMTGMLNLTYNIDFNNKIFFNTLYFHQSSSKTFEGFGFNNDLDLDNFFTRRITNNEKHLVIMQLLTNHNIIEDIFDFNFGVTLSRSLARKPKRSQISSIGKGENSQLFTLNASNNHVYWDNLDDSDKSLKLDFLYKKGKHFSLNFGYQSRFIDRSFSWRQLNLVEMGSSKLDKNLNTNQTQFYINNQMSNKKLYYKDQADPSRDFSFNRYVNAFFSSVDFNISNGLDLVFEIRMEFSDRVAKYKKMGDTFEEPFRESIAKYNDLVSSLSVKYSIDDKSNLRTAISKTITRPKVREVFPNQYQEYMSGAITQGNPNLVNSQNYNWDIKYEVFPSSDQMLSFSVFGKYLLKPIEKVNIPESGVIYTFRNVKYASVLGAEIEIDYKLENLFSYSFLKGLILEMDITGQLSNVVLSDDDAKFLTNSQRPLQGASPYIFSTSLGYDFSVYDDIKSNITLSHYFFGKRIYSAGSEGAQDVYEAPYNSLDIVLRNNIKDGIKFNVSIENILDPLIVLKQGEYKNKNTIIDQYTKGIEFSFSINYEF